MIDIKQNNNGTALNVSGDTIARSYAEGTILSLPKNSVYMVLEEASDLVIFRNVADNTILFQGLIREITIDGKSVTRDDIVSSFGAISNTSAGGGGGGTSYDDTELRNRIKGVEDAQAEDLAKINDLQQKLNGVNEVQEKLVSGTNIKTINGESLLGSGNITIQGGSTIDAYTKQESDNKYATKSSLESVENNVNSIESNISSIENNISNIENNVSTIEGKIDNIKGITPEQEQELSQLRSDVEDVMGEIAELGADKQNKLSGNYLVKFEQNGGQIDFTQRGFDGLSESTKSISFKTVNGQSLLGQGDLKIEGGGTVDAYSKQEADEKFATKDEVPTLQNKKYVQDNDDVKKQYIYALSPNQKYGVVAGLDLKFNTDSVQILIKDWYNYYTQTNIAIEAATDTVAGVMSAADKVKLDSLEPIDTSSFATNEYVDSKLGDINNILENILG